MTISKDLDIVLYGATGFTGTLCAEYLAKSSGQIKWAVAGRNYSKLEKLVRSIGVDVEVIVADSDDVDGLEAFTARSYVVLSTAGPFHRYGSNLVAACVKNSTHYVDITGENFWVKGLIEKHHEAASKKGVRIIPSCGFDSIPSDLGSFYAIKKAGVQISQIEAFHSYKGEASGGTLETMFSMPDVAQIDDMTNPFLLNPVGTFTPEMKKNSKDKYSIISRPEIKGYGSPFIMAGANTRVVRRSAALSELVQEPYGANFVYNEYAYHSSWWQAIKGMFGMAMIGGILFSPLRKLLRPMFRQPGDGPSKDIRDKGWFDCKFILKTATGKRLISSIRGEGDPGYKVTSKLLAESAMCLVQNADELPGGKNYGGVLTSATGLGMPLVERLKKVGIEFDDPKET